MSFCFQLEAYIYSSCSCSSEESCSEACFALESGRLCFGLVTCIACRDAVRSTCAVSAAVVRWVWPVDNTASQAHFCATTDLRTHDPLLHFRSVLSVQYYIPIIIITNLQIQSVCKNKQSSLLCVSTVDLYQVYIKMFEMMVPEDGVDFRDIQQ